MFQDLDDTLTQVLDDAKAPVELAKAEVSFVTPDKNFAPMKTAVNLFLYDVKENRELRDAIPIVEKVGDTFVRRRPPLRVNCAYIVTAWSIGMGDGKVKEEHQLLGQALLWLTRFPTIPTKYLKGSLLNPPFPHPTMVAQMDGNNNAGEFWSALGIPPRPAFYLSVTIAMDLQQEPIEGKLVTTKIAGYRLAGEPETEEALITIGGRVLTNVVPPQRPQPIADARAVIDNFPATTTDAEGRFIINDLVAGAYLLRVTARGFKPGEKAITIPGRPEDYEIKLDPL